jgi:hypothetical protein
VDDEEVPGEPELRDERQLALDLRHRLRPACAAWAAVAAACALEGAVPQLTVERRRVLQVGVGELVAEIAERERAPLRHRARIAHRIRNVAEQRRHFRRSANMAFAIPRQRAASRVERRLQADAGERVE